MTDRSAATPRSTVQGPQDGSNLTPAGVQPSAAQLAEQLRTDGSLLAGERANLAQQVIAAVRREHGGA